MKRILSTFLVLVISISLILSVSGCGTDTKTSDQAVSENTSAASAEAGTEPEAAAVTETEAQKPVTLTIWAWDKNLNVAAMETAGEMYKKINPNVTLNIVEIGSSDVSTKLNTALATKSTDTLPDITLMEDYYAYKFLSLYSDMYVDLTNVMPYNDFAKSKVATGTYNGKTYCVPFDSGVTGMFYRRDVFEEAGITEADLQNITFEQYIEMGKKIKAKTGKYLVSFDITSLGHLLQPIVQSAGSWLYDQDGNLNIKDNAALRETFEVYKAYVDNDIAKVVDNWGDMPAQLNNGTAVSAVNAVWYTSAVKQGADQSGKWGVAPPPRLKTPGSVNASNNGGSSWYVFAGKENSQAAVDFLKAMLVDSKEFYGDALVNQGLVGTYIPSQNISAYEQPDPFFNNQKAFQLFRDMIPTVPAINYGKYTGEARNIISSIMPEYIQGRMTIDQLIDEIDKQITTQTK